MAQIESPATLQTAADPKPAVGLSLFGGVEVVSFVIQLSDGRVIIPGDGSPWTEHEAQEFLAELRRQAENDDGGDDLIDVFDFVIEDYSRALSDASIIHDPRH
ncbi:hypothetical protein [Mycobacterium avium]|uniref:hypothetical protein n=1 Tax=Mycobacterium avium TaxID=1764 RepID=UPI00124FD218|nr:hypothetical protein [Mycobacterium avium]